MSAFDDGGGWGSDSKSETSSSSGWGGGGGSSSWGDDSSSSGGGFGIDMDTPVSSRAWCAARLRSSTWLAERTKSNAGWDDDSGGGGGSSSGGFDMSAFGDFDTPQQQKPRPKRAGSVVKSRDKSQPKTVYVKPEPAKCACFIRASCVSQLSSLVPLLPAFEFTSKEADMLASVSRVLC